MKGRVRPIGDAPDIAMLYRIEVKVVHVPRKIALVAQRMFPVAPLPDAALAFGRAVAEIRPPLGGLRENAALINRQRSGKSASPSGKVQMAWR
jgi:hypothetical protein